MSAMSFLGGTTSWSSAPLVAVDLRATGRVSDLLRDRFPEPLTGRTIEGSLTTLSSSNASSAAQRGAATGLHRRPEVDGYHSIVAQGSTTTN
jgi:hypothetical protein